jgi:Protein of unknown function (DUF3370)
VLVVETPVKQDNGKNELLFFTIPESQIFLRGTGRLHYTDDQGTLQTRYIHLVQRRGQQGEPLVTLNLKGGALRLV